MFFCLHVNFFMAEEMDQAAAPQARSLMIEKVVCVCEACWIEKVVCVVSVCVCTRRITIKATEKKRNNHTHTHTHTQ